MVEFVCAQDGDDRCDARGPRAHRRIHFDVSLRPARRHAQERGTCLIRQLPHIGKSIGARRRTPFYLPNMATCLIWQVRRNEEVDPSALIARLREENKKLREVRRLIRELPNNEGLVTCSCLPRSCLVVRDLPNREGVRGRRAARRII